MLHEILEICICAIGLLYILTVAFVICYEIMTYEGIHPDYISDEMWEFLSNQWIRNEYDIKTYHKVAKAKKKEYKHYKNANQ